VTRHARERYQERGGDGQLTSAKARRHLMGALGSGMEAENGAVVAPFGQKLYGVFVPESWGGWSLVTILSEGERVVS